MKLSLAFLAAALALCATSARSQDVSDLSADEQILISIASTNQTDGPDPREWPNQPVAGTKIASNTSDSNVDVVIPDADDSVSKRSGKSESYNLGNIVYKRANNYDTLTDGTDPRYQSAALQAPAYLTYKVISNTTSYGTAKTAGLDYCDSVDGCVAANMYKEIGNPLLDHVFSEQSNRKCALYGDIPTLSQMTNVGGQQLYGEDSPPNRIEESALFVANELPTPNTPAGYVYSFGPLDAATSAAVASGYMGYEFITRYDAQQCADLCDARGEDDVGGRCKFFNIWRGLVQGEPTTYTCAFFYDRTDASTATNTGDPVNGVTVTYSYGYSLGGDA